MSLRLSLVVLVLIVFVVVYPVANTDAPGWSSGDDNSPDLGASTVPSGRFPYSQTTYLGKVLRHFAGALVTEGRGGSRGKSTSC